MDQSDHPSIHPLDYKHLYAFVSSCKQEKRVTREIPPSPICLPTWRESERLNVWWSHCDDHCDHCDDHREKLSKKGFTTRKNKGCLAAGGKHIKTLKFWLDYEDWRVMSYVLKREGCYTHPCYTLGVARVVKWMWTEGHADQKWVRCWVGIRGICICI